MRHRDDLPNSLRRSASPAFAIGGVNDRKPQAGQAGDIRELSEPTGPAPPPRGAPTVRVSILVEADGAGHPRRRCDSATVFGFKLEAADRHADHG